MRTTRYDVADLEVHIQRHRAIHANLWGDTQYGARFDLLKLTAHYAVIISGNLKVFLSGDLDLCGDTILCQNLRVGNDRSLVVLGK